MAEQQRREDPWRPVPVLVACLLVLAVVFYPDGDDGAGQHDSGAGPAAAQTQVSVGQVAGRLPGARRRRAARAVAGVVDRWFDAAYAVPRSPDGDAGDRFPGFTPPARRLAAGHARVTTNQRLAGRVDEVRVRDRVVTVDLLAPKGRLAGATARVRYVLVTSGELRRRVRVTGRLALTPAGKGQGWRIFAFDLARRERTA